MPEALEHLTQEEAQKLIDMDAVSRAAIKRVEHAGIIFLDEIDKIAGREGAQGPDVSREGVQRDILPIVEGTTVNTKYGMVRTDHILFIAAGAFHVSKPSDLIPELQGRFPIRVELEALGRDEFVRILTEPKNALIKQYVALMATEGVRARVHARRPSSGIAELATLVNERTENIGARRLHTVLERLLDEVSFHAPELGGQIDYDRRALRGPHARRHRQERRPVALHPVKSGSVRRYVGTLVRGYRIRVLSRFVPAYLRTSYLRTDGAFAAPAARRGPPLPPLRPVPGAISTPSHRATTIASRSAATVPAAESRSDRRRRSSSASRSSR